MITMDNSTIFTKSEKGNKALSHRSSRELTGTERHILILVDGQKTAKELISQLSILKNVSAILEDLLQKGFIQTEQSLKTKSNNNGSSTNQSKQNTGTQFPLTEHNLSVLENALIEFLGPMGRFVFLEISEKATTFEEFNTAILAELSRDQRGRYKEMLANLQQ